MSDRRTTEEQEVSDRNFRSSYYKSLGFKDSEKSITHLEALLKADVFDVKRLKLFCLKHTLTVFYRPLVWKIILSVIPVFSDNDTCSFVKEQKKIEFQDLKSALQVMGRIENSTVGGLTGGGGEAPVFSEFSLHSVDSSSPSTPTTLHSLPFFHPHKLGSTIKEKQLGPKSVAESSSNQSTTIHDHRTLLMAALCTPRDFVTIFLLENNRLLSIAVSQLKQEEQVNMLAIAEAFLMLFEEESEDEIYWLFSNFMKKLESQFSIKENLFESFNRTLGDIDCALLEHIKDLDALDKAIPLQRWFQQCYARNLPESCIGSVWDRVIGGSSMILVYVAVGILVSNKRRIFSFTSAQQIEHLLDTIPQENYGAIVGKAIELWEANGSPLTPSKVEDSPSHELQYEIEDYT